MFAVQARIDGAGGSVAGFRWRRVAGAVIALAAVAVTAVTRRGHSAKMNR
jgi:hypothetical protein